MSHVSVGGWQEGALAEHSLYVGSWHQTLLASRETSLDSSAVVVSDADAFVVRKHLKGPKSECASVLHSLSSPFPLGFS